MRLQGKKIATLVAEGVEDLEYYVPLMRLQEEGAQVLTAGLDLQPVRGKNGLEITPDTKIDSLNPDDLFALIVPGGWAPDKLRRHSAVKELVRSVEAQGKIVGIICHGGLIAISAGIVRDLPQAPWASKMTLSMPAGPGKMNLRFATAIWSGDGWWRISRISAVSWFRR